MLLNWVKPCAEEIIEDYQADFTQGKLTVNLKYKVKKNCKTSLNEYDQDKINLLIVNFKAYKSIKRSRLW